MNVSQARELYSAYYEGALEVSASQAFEKALNADEEVRTDYATFAAVMDSLPALAEENILVPRELHDQIMQKLDLHDYESKQKKGFGFGQWTKLVYGGLAAAVLILAGVAVFRPVQGTNPTAGELPTIITPQFKFSADNSVHLVVHGSRVGTVSVQSTDGVTSQDYDLSKGDIDEPLLATGDDPVVVTVSGKGIEAVRLVLPGKTRKPMLSGEGSYDDCGKAIASTYGAPVEIIGEPNNQCRWAFTDTDSSANLVGALSRSNISASLSSDKILEITSR